MSRTCLVVVNRDLHGVLWRWYLSLTVPVACIIFSFISSSTKMYWFFLLYYQKCLTLFLSEYPYLKGGRGLSFSRSHPVFGLIRYFDIISSVTLSKLFIQFCNSVSVMTASVSCQIWFIPNDLPTLEAVEWTLNILVGPLKGTVSTKST